jgi:hypothetical protein
MCSPGCIAEAFRRERVRQVDVERGGTSESVPPTGWIP